jgi:uncharacterized protein YecT (DUF1311 family)
MNRAWPAVALFWSVTALAASFPCDKAQSRIEKAICADAEVSTLDEHLARYYQAARAALQGAVQCLAADQRQWLNSVRNRCADAGCLKKVYLERLSELDALQPGATALKNVALPKVPTLVWIIPPARDNVAAPPKPNARPLVVRGELVDDLTKGDGFLLRGAQGTTLLAMLMFLDGDTAQQLSVLAKVPNAVYLARGHAASDASGKIYYEPSRCVYLYRLP